MKTSKLTRLIALFLAALCCVGTIVVTGSASGSEPGSASEEEQAASSISAMREYLDAIKYTEYYNAYRNQPAGTANVAVDLTNFTANAAAAATRRLSEMTDAELEALGVAGQVTAEQKAKSVYIADDGAVSFTVNVPASGLYYIAIDYLTVNGTVNNIERKFYISNSVPFKEASSLRFSKNWNYRYETDDEGNNKFTRDLNGNDIQPELVQANRWGTYVCNDSVGYTNGFFVFFLAEGNNVLTFEAEREPVIFGGIELYAATADSPFRSITMQQYLEKVAQYPNGTQMASKSAKTVIEAEKPDLVSDNSVFMTSDRSS
ncbi:MAG: hypothetical protein IK090_07650, partial [Clostridia bacterium]|nr:hypothetical protein [Clostridia bacterium]